MNLDAIPGGEGVPATFICPGGKAESLIVREGGEPIGPRPRDLLGSPRAVRTGSKSDAGALARLHVTPGLG